MQLGTSGPPRGSFMVFSTQENIYIVRDSQVQRFHFRTQLVALSTQKFADGSQGAGSEAWGDGDVQGQITTQ